jgi:acetylornithine/succinyldiaminopimelate/putrescine aminotransferase
MNNRDVAKLTDQFVAHTYARYPIALVRGKGARVWDADGKEYLDFLAGIAVNGLGHCHPAVVKAIQQQSRKLLHVSNLYHIQPQAELARELCRSSFADRVFFCNSGAEANEAAIKLAPRRAIRDFDRAQLLSRTHAGNSNRDGPGEGAGRLRSFARGLSPDSL